MTKTRPRMSDGKVFGGLGAVNLLAAVLLWVGYTQTPSPASGIPAAVATVLSVVYGVAYFHRRIRALERAVEGLRTAQE